jgi:hypothetical protein
MKTISTNLALLFSLLPLVHAEEAQSPDTQHIRAYDVAYKSSIGKRVVVDALVWHYIGTSGRGGGEVITPTGQVIFVRDAYKGSPRGIATQVLPQGKLVRITGTLELGPAPTQTVDGRDAAISTGDTRSHLNLRMESFKLVEIAEYPWPRKIRETAKAAVPNPRSEQNAAGQPATRPEAK